MLWIYLFGLSTCSVIVLIVNGVYLYLLFLGGLLNAADRWKLLLETSVSHGVPLTSEDTSNELTIESVIKAMVGEVGVEEACQVLNRVEGLQGSELPCSLQQFLISAAALHREKRYNPFLVMSWGLV